MSAISIENQWSAAGAFETQACEKYCVFQQGRTTSAVLASVVREVALTPKIAMVPDADPLLAGVCHLRNEFMPVLRGLNTLRGDLLDATSQQIVVISVSGGPCAMLVDRVLGLVPLDVSLGSDAGTVQQGALSVMGSATYQGQIVRVLDANAVCRNIEESLNRFWQQELGSGE